MVTRIAPLVLASLFTSAAYANPISFQFLHPTNGDSGPVAHLVVTETDSSTLHFTVQFSADSPGSFVSRLWLNLPTGLSSPFQSDLDPVSLFDGGIEYGAFNVGSHGYGAKQRFQTSAHNRFLTGTSASFSLSAPGLNASSYMDGFSTGSSPAMVHIQNFGPQGESMHVQAVPEPSGIALLALGGAMVARRRRRLTA
jgi:hypothetical protein